MFYFIELFHYFTTHKQVNDESDTPSSKRERNKTDTVS